MIKRYLFTIGHDIQDEWKKFKVNFDVNNFIETLESMVKHYSDIVYKCGKNILVKNIGEKIKLDINELDTKEINNFYIQSFDPMIKKLCYVLKNEYDRKSLLHEKIFSDFLQDIIGQYVILYRWAQIQTCIQLDINKIKFIPDDKYSCAFCKVLCKFIYDPKDIQLDYIHPYCKLIIEPLDYAKMVSLNIGKISIQNIPVALTFNIKNTLSKISIYLKDMLSEKIFIFDENVDSIIIENNIVYIPMNFIEHGNVEYIILRYLLKDNLLKLFNETWQSMYKNKKLNCSFGENSVIYHSFISNICQYNAKEYFLESVLAYLLTPNELKNLDNEVYQKIKTEVLNDIEFIRG